MNFNKANDDLKYVRNEIDYDKQFDYTDKCDFIGFKPLSVRIKEMKMKGELNELLSALENNDIPLSDFFRHYSDEDAHTKPISVLNIKGLDRVELNNQLIARAKKYELAVASYKQSLSTYKSSNNSNLEAAERTPQTESEHAGDIADSK